MNLKKKIFLITGGTGSFGNAVLKRLLKTNISQIRIFSRDEKKQNDLRLKINDKRLKFIIGDVRDYTSIKDAMVNVNYVFHAAVCTQRVWLATSMPPRLWSYTALTVGMQG